MNFKEALKRVEDSQEFKTFRENHSEAKVCAGFFIEDYLSNDSKNSIDYMEGEKIFTFNIFEDKIAMQEDKLMDLPNTPKLEPIIPETNTEVEELKELAQTKAHEEGIGAKFNKIIAVLQKHTIPETNEKIQIWNLTCMLDQLIILHILINTDSKEIIKFERKSFMDMIKQK